MKSNDSPEVSSTIPRGVFWPLKYVWLSIKQNPFMLVAGCVLPLIAEVLTYGYVETILQWCLPIIPLALLTSSAMRIAAADIAPEHKLEPETRAGMVARVTVASAMSLCITGALIVGGSMGTMLGNLVTRTDEKPFSAIQGTQPLLVIEPAVIPKQAIRRGEVIKANNVYVRDMNVAKNEFDVMTESRFVRNPEKLVGRIALEDMPKDVPIERLYVGPTEEKQQQLLKQGGWHKPGRIVAARVPIKKGEVVSSDFLVERTVPDVPVGACQSKDSIDSGYVTANLAPNQTLMLLDVQTDPLTRYDDPMPADFNTRFVHEYMVNPITGERLKYGKYSEQSFATEPIAKGTVISARNIKTRYVQIKMDKFGYPEKSFKQSAFFNYVIGDMALRDIAKNEVLSWDAIGAYKGNQQSDTPNAAEMFLLNFGSYARRHHYWLPYLVPMSSIFIWCLLYVRFCFTSTGICVNGSGIFGGAIQSWQLSRGKTVAISLHLLKFCIVYWLLTISIAVVSGSVRFFELANSREPCLSLALLALAFFLLLIASMVMSIITVPLYFQLLERAERIATGPGSPVKPSKTVTLGCGTLHGKSEEDPIPLDISTTAEADVMGVSNPLTHT
jgi:flagella basal body P-ring formation protein FlgA